MMQVPFVDLKAQNRFLKAEILVLWDEILDSAGFVGGKHVIGFEEEFAEACSVEHCILVNSGTDALRFIFLALGLEEGDEIITVPNTFIATTEAISQSGARIAFVDIDPNTYNMDSSKLESTITSRTKGIVPVHLYGQTADMDPILDIAEKYGLWVVEDACQAHLAEYKGRKAGSIGIAGAFSFYPGKNLGACGEGGAVTTHSGNLAAKIRMLRDHGQARKYHHMMEGYNGRCDALQAASLRVKLKHLTLWNEARRKNAQHYFERLKTLDSARLPEIADGCLPTYHLFVVQVDNRDAVAETLKEKGISTGLHYPVPLHLQDAYAYMRIPEGSFPVTESSAKKLLSLPMFPELTVKQIEFVCDELRIVLENLAGKQSEERIFLQQSHQ
jgi:dTDP-4-amino-4,6-dideoxygalactose transaminase